MQKWLPTDVAFDGLGKVSWHFDFSLWIPKFKVIICFFFYLFIHLFLICASCLYARWRVCLCVQDCLYASCRSSMWALVGLSGHPCVDIRSCLYTGTLHDTNMSQSAKTQHCGSEFILLITHCNNAWTWFYIHLEEEESSSSLKWTKWVHPVRLSPKEGKCQERRERTLSWHCQQPGVT